MTADRPAHPIHALWAHPRSTSTMLERVMRERGDLDCLHEPFLYDYYIHRGMRDLPLFDPEPGQPVSYAEARADILRRAAATPVFFKDMSFYVLPHMLDDPLTAQISHAFVVRDPRAAIASYAKLDPDMTEWEIGIAAQWQHYTALRDRGIDAQILISDAVRRDPQAQIARWWRAIGLPPAPEAFSWDKDAPEDWGHVSGWHESVMASQEVRPPTDDAGERFAAAAATLPRLNALLAHHAPYYDMFVAAAKEP